MIVLLATIARAEPNGELLPALSVTHGPRGWGVELAATVSLALGDHCAWAETDCRDGLWWPTVGPRVSGGWRGGRAFGFAIEGLVGVSALDMHQFGFLPMFRAEAVGGVDFELGLAPLPVVGGQVTKSPSWRRSLGLGYQDLGVPQVSLALGVRAPRGQGWRASAGLESVTMAADED